MGQGRATPQLRYNVASSTRLQMVELLRTNDLVLLSYIRALLSAEGIRSDDLDQHMNLVDGNIGAIPRRLMVDEKEVERARRLLSDAGLGHVIKR